MPELRILDDADRSLILHWRNLPAVADYMYSNHTITSAEHDRWFDTISGDPTRWYRIIEVDGEPVGLASISDINESFRRCSWAFYLASDVVRGRGVGSWVEYEVLSTVFTELGLNKLCCEVLATNTSVISMHESFGFRREALLRQHVWKGGEPVDVVALALLRSEWLLLQPSLRDRMVAKGLSRDQK